MMQLSFSCVLSRVLKPYLVVFSTLNSLYICLATAMFLQLCKLGIQGSSTVRQ